MATIKLKFRPSTVRGKGRHALLSALPPSGEQADYHRHEDISRVVE